MLLILHYHAKILSAQIRAEKYLQTVGNSYLLNTTIFETLAFDFDKRQLHFLCLAQKIPSSQAETLFQMPSAVSPVTEREVLVDNCWLHENYCHQYSLCSPYPPTAMSFTCKPCFSNIVKLGLHVTVSGQYPLQLHDVNILSPATS